MQSQTLYVSTTGKTIDPGIREASAVFLPTKAKLTLPSEAAVTYDNPFPPWREIGAKTPSTSLKTTHLSSVFSEEVRRQNLTERYDMPSLRQNLRQQESDMSFNSSSGRYAHARSSKRQKFIEEKDADNYTASRYYTGSRSTSSNIDSYRRSEHLDRQQNARYTYTSPDLTRETRYMSPSRDSIGETRYAYPSPFSSDETRRSSSSPVHRNMSSSTHELYAFYSSAEHRANMASKLKRHASRPSSADLRVRFSDVIATAKASNRYGRARKLRTKSGMPDSGVREVIDPKLWLTGTKMSRLIISAPVSPRCTGYSLDDPDVAAIFLKPKKLSRKSQRKAKAKIKVASAEITYRAMSRSPNNENVKKHRSKSARKKARSASRATILDPLFLLTALSDKAKEPTTRDNRCQSNSGPASTLGVPSNRSEHSSGSSTPRLKRPRSSRGRRSRNTTGTASQNPKDVVSAVVKGQKAVEMALSESNTNKDIKSSKIDLDHPCKSSKQETAKAEAGRDRADLGVVQPSGHKSKSQKVIAKIDGGFSQQTNNDAGVQSFELYPKPCLDKPYMKEKKKVLTSKPPTRPVKPLVTRTQQGSLSTSTSLVNTHPTSTPSATRQRALNPLGSSTNPIVPRTLVERKTSPLPSPSPTESLKSTHNMGRSRSNAFVRSRRRSSRSRRRSKSRTSPTKLASEKKPTFPTGADSQSREAVGKIHLPLDSGVGSNKQEEAQSVNLLDKSTKQQRRKPRSKTSTNTNANSKQANPPNNQQPRTAIGQKDEKNARRSVRYAGRTNNNSSVDLQQGQEGKETPLANDVQEEEHGEALAEDHTGKDMKERSTLSLRETSSAKSDKSQRSQMSQPKKRKKPARFSPSLKEKKKFVFTGWDGEKALAPHTMTQLPEYADTAAMLLEQAAKLKVRETEILTRCYPGTNQGPPRDAAGVKSYLAKHDIEGLFTNFTTTVLNELPPRPIETMEKMTRQIEQQRRTKEDMTARFPFLRSRESKERMRDQGRLSIARGKAASLAPQTAEDLGDEGKLSLGSEVAADMEEFIRTRGHWQGRKRANFDETVGMGQHSFSRRSGDSRQGSESVSRDSGMNTPGIDSRRDSMDAGMLEAAMSTDVTSAGISRGPSGMDAVLLSQGVSALDVVNDGALSASPSGPVSRHLSGVVIGAAAADGGGSGSAKTDGAGADENTDADANDDASANADVTDTRADASSNANADAVTDGSVVTEGGGGLSIDADVAVCDGAHAKVVTDAGADVDARTSSKVEQEADAGFATYEGADAGANDYDANADVTDADVGADADAGANDYDANAYVTGTDAGAGANVYDANADVTGADVGTNNYDANADVTGTDAGARTYAEGDIVTNYVAAVVADAIIADGGADPDNVAVAGFGTNLGVHGGSYADDGVSGFKFTDGGAVAEDVVKADSGADLT